MSNLFDKSFIMSIPDWMKIPILGVEKLTLWQIFALLLLVFLAMLGRLVFRHLISNYIQRIFHIILDESYDSVISKALLPLSNLVLAGILALFLPSVGFNFNLSEVLLIIIRTYAALNFVIFTYRVVDVLIHFLEKRPEKTKSKLDDQLVPLIGKALKITVVVMGSIFVLQNLKIDVTSLLAGVTIGGLAFSFAAKDTISNLFGSLTVLIDKPFIVGNWVKTSGTEGVVEAIGFRSTRIRTFYNSLVTVPNNKFTEVVVDNLGMRKYRRSLSTLDISYNTSPDQIEAFCNGIRAIIKNHKLTRKDYYEVHFSGFGESSLKIMVYFFFKVSGWSDELRGKHEVFLDILRLAKDLKVEMAYPTRTLYMKDPLKEVSSIPTEKEKNQFESIVEEYTEGGKSHIPNGPRLGKLYLSKD